MPVYDYECVKCRHQFELRRRFGENGTVDCPRCQGEARRLFTAVPVIFKGSGFYVTDHRKEKPAEEPRTPAGEEKPAAAKTNED